MLSLAARLAARAQSVSLITVSVVSTSPLVVNFDDEPLAAVPFRGATLVVGPGMAMVQDGMPVVVFQIGA